LKYLIGYDIGSSSIKAALVEAETGRIVATAYSPANEMPIISLQPGFAEQDPETWWTELILATKKIQQQKPYQPDEIIAIGISYQMHGLVCVDEHMKPVRDSIIWCDSRAVAIGQRAYKDLGERYCEENFLNAPGNFTASKLKWVQENEAETFRRIHKIMLPGDYIALKLSGEATTTITGLSEGILWNFKTSSIAREILNYYNFDENILSTLVPIFGEQSRVTKQSGDILGFRAGTPICYRAGDQPNNAFSLNVLKPGEIAATAGTSGVVYGIADKPEYDPQSRVNTFVHVNHTAEHNRYGVLLCINGTGILYNWLRKNCYGGLSYDQINYEASKIPVGSEGLFFFPFGNGAERILNNKNIAATVSGLQFNTHNRAHLARSAQEGIVFALNYGMEIMHDLKIDMRTIRAGMANMFLSEVFTQTFSNVTECVIELYNTDGAIGAARAAGYGVGYYKSFSECFSGMELIKKIEPEKATLQQAKNVYQDWKKDLLSLLEK
jgi:xylulokinase